MKKYIVVSLASILNAVSAHANIAPVDQSSLVDVTSMQNKRELLIQSLVLNELYDQMNAIQYVLRLDDDSVDQLLQTLDNEKMLVAAGPGDMAPLPRE